MASTAETIAESRIGAIEIRIKGRDTNVPSLAIDNAYLISTGGWLKIVRLFDEDLVERKSLPHPEIALEALRNSPLPADLFSIAQRVPDIEPRFPYYAEWDNWAVASTSSFQRWWDALPQESRKNARLAEKRGIVVRRVTFDDQLIHGIKRIYDETPVRQGRAFWHYQKPFDAVKKENGTYLPRSVFIGAYLGDELIGFIKYICVDDIAILIQILAMAEHRDKKPMNALLKHTMEICAQQNLASIVYGQYHYGTNNDSSLTEFKRRNGFSEVRFPRYFIPVTMKGRFALTTGLHRGIRMLIPTEVSSLIVKYRGKILNGRRK